MTDRRYVELSRPDLSRTLSNTGLSGQSLQQLSNYLYGLGENVEYIREVAGLKVGVIADDDRVEIRPGPAPDVTLGQSLLSSFNGVSTLFPWTYGVAYNNRNEYQARTSGNGVYVLEQRVGDSITRKPAADFAIRHI